MRCPLSDSFQFLRPVKLHFLDDLARTNIQLDDVAAELERRRISYTTLNLDDLIENIWENQNCRNTNIDAVSKFCYDLQDLQDMSLAEQVKGIADAAQYTSMDEWLIAASRLCTGLKA